MATLAEEYWYLLGMQGVVRTPARIAGFEVFVVMAASYQN
jgi:hypothetical protein